MKSSTGELLDMREGKAQQEHTGYTGALELYDELINFLGLASGTKRPTASPQPSAPSITQVELDTPSFAAQPLSLAAELDKPVNQPAADTSQETRPALVATASGALTQPTPRDALAQLTPGDVLTQTTSGDALTQSEDIIRVTGSLAGFMVTRNPNVAMVNCGDCGNSSNSGEMFCIHCGGLLEEAVAPTEVAIALAGFCEDCGATVENDEIFCPSCGSVMTGD